MNRGIPLSFLAITTLALALAAPAEAVTVERDYLETFTVSPGDRLELDHGDGDVSIEPWDKDELEVRVRYHAEFKGVGARNTPDFTVDFEQSGDTVRVTGRETVNWQVGIFINRRNEYIYEIHAPSHLVLDLSGDDGDLEIKGWRADIESTLDDGDVTLVDVRTQRVSIRTEDGDVVIEGFEGALDLDAEDGDIEISDCKSSPLSIRAEDGDIDIVGCRGDFDLAVEDGDISVREASVGKLAVRASDGDVSLALAEARDLDLTVRVDDGNVSVTLPPGTSAAFELESDDGRLAVANDDWVLARKDHRVTGRIGDGQGRIEIEAEDGNVSLR